MSKLLQADDLLNSLSNIHTLNGTAQITLLNNCPPKWNVVILVAGIKFFYSDGTDYTDGPRSVMLSSGQSATFMSNDPEGCVQNYFVAMTVKAGNEEPKNMTYQDGVGPDECLLHTTLVLGPKNVRAKGSRTSRVSDLLELKSSE